MSASRGSGSRTPQVSSSAAAMATLVLQYNRVSWHRRRRHQLLTHPLCKFCLAKGRNVPASVADHVIPHNGDLNLFLLGELQSLCSHCHSCTKQYEERKGHTRHVGLDGWPTDPRHPSNQASSLSNKTKHQKWSR